MRPYKPVSCDFVDIIEHYATLRTVVNVTYRVNDKSQRTVSSRILTWENKEGVEYIVLKENHLNIRMDDIVKINDVGPYDGHCAIDE